MKSFKLSGIAQYKKIYIFIVNSQNMDYSERNKKVANNRWKKKFDEEKNKIKYGLLAEKNKAILCGFISGDGSLQRRKVGKYVRYQLDFFPDDNIMLKKYVLAMNYIYDKNPSIFKKKNFDAVRITSKVLSQDLMKLSNFGLKKWEIPDWILKNKKYIVLWLKAFFSAEAYVGKNSIKIQTVNEKGMLQIKYCLLKLNIDCNYYSYEPKKHTYSSVRIIIIAKKLARERYFEKIGFFHGAKTNKLKESLGL